MAIKFNENFKFNIEHENLIETLTHQIAIAIERENLSDAKQKAIILAESEKLHEIILNSVSHEFAPPITTISFSAMGLMDDTLFKNEELRKVLASDIILATERLNRTVGNLLDMVRLESGKLKLNLQWHSIDDFLSVVISKVEKELISHEFVREIENDLPMIQIDFVLMEQVLTNLLLNASMHTDNKSKIILKIYQKDDFFVIIVFDNGNGLKEDEVSHIFEKFYRSKKTKTGGIGLGLSICRSIVEIYNGNIYAENNKEGGASFIIKLPLNKQ